MKGMIAQAAPQAIQDMPAMQAKSEAPPETAESSGSGLGMLKQIEQTIMQKVPAQIQKPFMAIVVAGRQLMFSEQTHPQMAEYLQVSDPSKIPQRVAHGIVKLISIVANEVTRKGKQFNIPAAAPAAVVLMTYALKYVEQQLGIPITKEMINQTTQLVVKGLLALFKVDKSQIDQAIQAALQKGQAEQPEDQAAETVPDTEPVEDDEEED